MKPETIAIIRDRLRMDVEDRKDRLLKMIEGGWDNGLDARIAEYRAAFNALDDFNDWADEQKDSE